MRILVITNFLHEYMSDPLSTGLASSGGVPSKADFSGKAPVHVGKSYLPQSVSGKSLEEVKGLLADGSLQLRVFCIAQTSES